MHNGWQSWLVTKHGGHGGTPYNGLCGEAPPKRGTFFRLEVYKRVGKRIAQSTWLVHVCIMGPIIYGRYMKEVSFSVEGI